MSNHTKEFSTENNDRVQLIPMNGGLIIHIVPVDKLPGQSAWDVFEIGLRKSSLKKLLLAIKRNESYSTDYHQNIIGRDKSGKIYFHNKTNLSVYPEHNCVLDADQSTEFIRLIGLFVNGLPPELEAFVGIEDGYVQHQVMKAVDEPALLNTPKFWDELGMAVGTAGVPTEAMNCFYKALQLDPDYHLSKLNLATSLNAIGNTIEALRLIEEVPNGTSRRNVIMGNTLRSAGRDLDAVPYFEKAVIEEPDFFLPYFNLLKILSANNHPLYEYWLEKSLELHRQVPVIAHFYTQLLLEQHRIDELADLDWVDHLQNTPSNLVVCKSWIDG